MSTRDSPDQTARSSSSLLRPYHQEVADNSCESRSIAPGMECFS
jgi:hypothetical protein